MVDREMWENAKKTRGLKGQRLFVGVFCGAGILGACSEVVGAARPLQQAGLGPGLKPMTQT